MTEKPVTLEYGSAPRRGAMLALLLGGGRFRWVGLLMFLTGWWVYADWDGATYDDWWVRRWAAVVALVGAVVYLEGIAAKIVAAVRSARGSHS